MRTSGSAKSGSGATNTCSSGNFPDIVEFIGAQNGDLEKYVKGGYLQKFG